MKDFVQKLHQQNISGKFLKIAVMKFTYGELYFINDLKSKDIKFQWEERLWKKLEIPSYVSSMD